MGGTQNRAPTLQVTQAAQTSAVEQMSDGLIRLLLHDNRALLLAAVHEKAKLALSQGRTSRAQSRATLSQCDEPGVPLDTAEGNSVGELSVSTTQTSRHGIS